MEIVIANFQSVIHILTQFTSSAFKEIDHKSSPTNVKDNFERPKTTVAETRDIQSAPVISLRIS